AQPTIVRLSFTRLVIGACCFVLLSVGSLDAQEHLSDFNVGSVLDEGYRHLDAGEFDKAEAMFKGVIEHDPKNRTALEGLVWVAFLAWRYGGGGGAGKKVRFLGPEDFGGTRKWIEVVWQDAARRGEALTVARWLLINDEDDIETRLLLAESL